MGRGRFPGPGAPSQHAVMPPWRIPTARDGLGDGAGEALTNSIACACSCVVSHQGIAMWIKLMSNVGNPQ